MLPRLQPDQVGLASIWQNGSVSLWRSVFDRRASDFIAPIEKLTGKRMGVGTDAGPVTAELLAMLRAAYQAAAT